MSTIAVDANRGAPAREPATTFDDAVRAAAQEQTARLREFGLRVARGEHEAYHRLLNPCS